MDNKKKERNRVGKYKKKRRGFINQRKLQLSTTQSESMHMQDGEEPDISLSAVGKTETEFVVEDVETLNTLNKIVPIAVNFNFT